MELKHIGSNMTEIRSERATVLFSYNTPVAALIPCEGWYRTDCRWSATTTKHINKWLNGVDG